MFIYIPPCVYLLILTWVYIKVCILLNSILMWVFKSNRWTYWKKNIKNRRYVCVYIYTQTHTHTSTRVCMLSHFSHVLLFATLWILQAKTLEWVAMPSSRDLPDPGIKPMSPGSPALQMDSLPTEPSGKHPPPHPPHTYFHLTNNYWVLIMSQMF